jgi:hypothetical protein
MKSNLELLKILKSCRRKFDPSIGLCSIAHFCKMSISVNNITPKEYKKIMKLLKAHRPNMSIHWFDGDGIERGKFLNKLIKKYSDKKCGLEKIK